MIIGRNSPKRRPSDRYDKAFPWREPSRYSRDPSGPNTCSVELFHDATSMDHASRSEPYRFCLLLRNRQHYESCDIVAMSECRTAPVKATTRLHDCSDVVVLASHLQGRQGPSIANVAISSPYRAVPAKSRPSATCVAMSSLRMSQPMPVCLRGA